MTANTVARPTPTARVVSKVRDRITGSHAHARPDLEPATATHPAANAVHTNDIGSAELRFFFRC